MVINPKKHEKQINELLLKRSNAVAMLEAEEEELEQVTIDLDHSEQAHAIILNIAQTIQQTVHARISNTVTRCLNSVFSDPYEFQIQFERKRGKTEARMVFLRDGLVLDDPLNQVGGGVIDVAAFGLRLACIMMIRPRRRRLLVLDEPLKNVRGKDNRMRVRMLLESLAEEMDMQIILNVDIDSYPEFAIGNVLEMGEEDDKS